MKAWMTYDFNDMRLEDIPFPKAQAGWVVLKVRVFQLSITEVAAYLGLPVGNHDKIERMLKEKRPRPLWGHEFCGEVVEVGKDVTNVKIGDRTFYHRGVPCHQCPLCQTGHEGYCRGAISVGVDTPGCMAEYFAVPASTIASIPEVISDGEAAAMQPLASVVGDVEAAHIEMGDTVAVIGQGPMGLAVLQVSRACGAGRVIAIARRDKVLALSQELGASVTINATRVDPVTEVKKITDGVGADVVFECAGAGPDRRQAGTMYQAIQMVRNEGKIVQVGFMPLDATFPVSALDKKGLHYIGRKPPRPRMIGYTIELVASGRVQLAPTITHVLEGLDKVPQAIDITANKAKYEAINPAQVVVTR